MTANESNKWLEERMMPYYPLGVLKHPDLDEANADEPLMKGA